MLLSEARINIVDASLWREGSYNNDHIDRALMVVGNDLANYTGCIVTAVNVSLSAASSAQNLTSTGGLTYLQPTFLDRAYIGNYRVRKADYDFVRRRLEAYPNQTGRPEFIAAKTDTDWHWFPTTDQAYTLAVITQDVFTNISPGQAANVELNIPHRYIRPALWEGCAARLVYGEAVGNPWPVTGWKLYLDYREEVKRMAAMDAGVPVTKETPGIWEQSAAPQRRAPAPVRA